MFGHDNDNNDHKGQISLPPAVDDDAVNAATEDHADEHLDIPSAPDASQVEAASEDVPTPPRKDHKTGAATDDLLDIKQDALHALTPLLNHLDQTPEEKFRTTMMMIQAADNHHLVKDAYEAALNISDEKERAQALLDIVNEINYFTQQNAA